MRGIFTSTILDGLWQGPPGGGQVTGDWLKDFVCAHLPAGPDGQAGQDPVFDYKQNYDIVFADCTAPRYRVLIHAKPADQSQQVEMWDGGGTRNVLPPSHRSNGTWEWELDPGIYEYGYSGGGDPRRVLELKGRGRVIDVQL